MRRRLPLATLLITLATLCFVAGSARAQSLPGLVPSAGPSLAPGVKQEGLYQTAPIRLDGATLFRVATSATGASGQLQAELRAQVIEDVLEEVIAKVSSDPSSPTRFDPKTLDVEVLPDGPQAMLVVNDRTHTRFPLMTVTSSDARYARKPVETLAAQWAQTLQVALVTALEKRQPGELRKSFATVLRVAIGMAVGTLGVWLIVMLIRRRIEALVRQIENTERSIGEPDSEERRRSFLDFAVRLSDPQLRLGVWRAASALLVWSVLLVWFIAIVWALSLFPETASLAQTIERRASRIVFIWVGAVLLLRLLDLVISRSARVAHQAVRGRDVKEDEKARQLLRIPTIATALHDLVLGIVVFAAALATMSALGLPIASVLTIGGVVAFAVSFAAQNLVRDFLNGILVLLEDQFVVGDYITVDQWSGQVERMTLRIVQIRDASGNLVTIPFGSAVVVVNGSRYWSRIDYRVTIAADSNVNKAFDVMKATLETLAGDPVWESANPAVEWIGIEAVGSSGMVLRASVKTAPLRQFDLRREINARVVAAFREAGIVLGVDPTLLSLPGTPPKVAKGL